MKRPGRVGRTACAVAGACALALPAAACTTAPTLRAAGRPTRAARLADCGSPAPGCRVWLRRVNDPANGIDQVSAEAVSPDGRAVFVTALASGASTGTDYLTRAYNATTGSQLWQARMAGSGNTIAYRG